MNVIIFHIFPDILSLSKKYNLFSMCYCSIMSFRTESSELCQEHYYRLICFSHLSHFKHFSVWIDSECLRETQLWLKCLSIWKHTFKIIYSQSAIVQHIITWFVTSHQKIKIKLHFRSRYKTFLFLQFFLSSYDAEEQPNSSLLERQRLSVLFWKWLRKGEREVFLLALVCWWGEEGGCHQERWTLIYVADMVCQ